MWSDGIGAVPTLGLFADAGAGTEAGAGGGAPAGGAGDDPGEAGGKGSNANGKDSDGGAQFKARIAELEGQLTKLNEEKEKILSESIGRKKKLQAYDDAGLTAAEAAELRKFKADREKKEREERGAYEEQLQKEREERAALERKSKEREASLLDQMIVKEILSAAGGLGALSHALEKLEGAEPQIVSVTRSMFEFDSERGEVVHRIVSSEKDPAKRMTVREYFERERNKSLANLFANTTKSGGGSSVSKDGTGKGVVTISRSDPHRLAKFEAAQKAGHEVEYTD